MLSSPLSPSAAMQLRLALVGACLVPTGIACGGSAVDLLVEETATYSVPNTFDLGAIQADRDGGLLLISQSKAAILGLNEEGRLDRSYIIPNATRVLAAAHAASGMLRTIVVGPQSSVSVVDLNGAEEGWCETTGLEGVEVVSGDLVDGQWVVVGRPLAPDSRDEGVLLRELKGDVPGRFEVVMNYSEGVTDVRLSADSVGMIISRPQQPFGGFVTNGRGEITKNIFADSVALAMVSMARVSWQALPLIELDRGYLQTIADRRSNRRAILRFDSRGRVTRIQLLEAPLALLEGGLPSGALWGARRAGEIEVVQYRWRWVGARNVEAQDWAKQGGIR